MVMGLWPGLDPAVDLSEFQLALLFEDGDEGQVRTARWHDSSVKGVARSWIVLLFFFYSSPRSAACVW